MIQPGRIINVLVVDDSAVAREFLVHALGSDPEIRVIGTAADGEEAISKVRQKKPDVVTMDMHMPRMNGLAATRKIMETQPTPIVIVTGSSSAHDVSATFRAIEAGALAIVARPPGSGHPRHAVTVNELIRTVKLMSEVKVIRRWPRRDREAGAAAEIPKLAKAKLQLVAMGASTGGPLALRTILSALPKEFAAPILIVQHIALGFVAGFVEWLAESSGYPVRLASDGDFLRAGHAYVAPDSAQMGVTADGRIALTEEAAEHDLCPSISYLFNSVANVYGPRAAGVLLTGMGVDGAAGLKLMRETGAVTIAQDEESSVIYGMPAAAIKLKAAAYVLSPAQIAALLRKLLDRDEKKEGLR